MGLNEKPMAERLHIGFFGVRNVGKSSVVNAVTGQNLSIVSDVKGTTTDAVSKTMEILPLGPVVIIDTPGIDDEGTLGELRVKKAKQVLNKTDIAVLVTDVQRGIQVFEKELGKLFASKNIPYLIVFNKCDMISDIPDMGQNSIYVSAKDGTNIYQLKEMLSKFQKRNDKKLIGDLIQANDIIVLVVPIDESAPKGRLILPQQQMIRDILEHNAISIVVKDTELKTILTMLPQKPKMVITDSQVFGKVSQIVSEDILLTSFSILFARYKGELKELVKGALMLEQLKDGDTVLISEACTHHRQCNDIGTVRLPHWIENYTHKKIQFEFTSGGDFPEDLQKYALIVHCGGCMLNEREMNARICHAGKCGVPITNYGTAIAQIHGILKRSLSPFL